MTSLQRKGKGRKASGKRKIASFPHLTPVAERSQYQGLLPSSRRSGKGEKERIEASSQNRRVHIPHKAMVRCSPRDLYGSRNIWRPPRDHFQQFKQRRDLGLKTLDEFRSQGKSLVAEKRLTIQKATLIILTIA